jgi:hypothetical protein
MPPTRKKSAPKRSHSVWPLVVLSLIFGGVMAHWLGNKTRHLAGNEWHDVPELRGKPLPELALANGQAVSLRDDSTAHVLYLFQYDCRACDAQRAHVAELLEGLPAAEVVSATAQPASLSPGYWGDLGSSLAPPVGADSTWLAAHDLDQLPMLVFVDKSGHIAKAIRGSLLSWSDYTLRNELAAAGAG